FSIAKSIGSGVLGAVGTIGAVVLNGSTWPGEAVLGNSKT
ncbi:unnamed protein product, partial [marine sediment metagenome]